MKISVLWVLPLLLLCSSCAQYAHRVQKPRNMFEAGQYDGAVTELKLLVDRNDNDKLIYLMDLGLVYHTAGLYKDAIATFREADKIADISDYTSLSQEAAAIAMSDEVKPYKGEDFEKLMINMYLAIDYAMLKDYDSALVECRKVNHKLDMMIAKGNLPYEQNAFAKYLAAVLFEARKEYNDAFVDYRQLLKWKGPQFFPYLNVGLLRLADKLHAEQELDEYKKLYPGFTKYRLDKNEGEVVLLVEQGRAPIKVPSPNFRLLPKFNRRAYTSDHVTIRDAAGKYSMRSYPLYDIENVAIKELDHRISLIAAKKIAGVVAKQAAGYAVEKATKSKLAGALTALVLHATDSADLRSWTTLPATLQLVRMTVPAGKQDIIVDVNNRGGYGSPSARVFKDVDVKPGQIVFLNYRTPEQGGYTDLIEDATAPTQSASFLAPVSVDPEPEEEQRPATELFFNFGE